MGEILWEYINILGFFPWNSNPLFLRKVDFACNNYCCSVVTGILYFLYSFYIYSLEFPSPLFNYLFIYIHMNSWLYILFHGLWSNISINFVTQRVQFWPFQFGSQVLSTSPHPFLSTSLLFGITHRCRLILYFPCPSHFSMESGFICWLKL